ncbi:MAG: sulfurtransferase [Bacillota bacterium]|nr:sulfurtransferase [Bacillota bacterium]
MTTRKVVIGILMVVIIGVLASCTVNTSYDGTRNIIEAAATVAKASEAGVVIVDARSPEEYAKGHMSRAISLTPGQLSIDTPVPAMLAPREQVERVLSEKGIQPSDTVIIYDDNKGVSAGRVWWTLKVYGHEKVLLVNGGASALVQAGAQLSAEPFALPASTYTAKDADLSLIASYEDVKKISENPTDGVVLLDVRSDAEFAEGFIPTAIHRPHTKNLYKDGTFMSARDIRLFYQDLGIRLEDEIVLYCKSSYRATQAAALLEEAGFTKVRIYDGAWLEWEKLESPSAPTTPVVPSKSDGS